MQKTDKLIINIDFRWIFTGDSELGNTFGWETKPGEEHKKYRIFLKKMYKSSTCPSLLLKKDEIELLKKYK